MVDKLTPKQIQRLRNFVGDVGKPQTDGSTDYVFSEPELEEEWQQSGGDTTKTVLSLILMLLGSTWHLHRYQQNASTEDRQQVPYNLRKLYDTWLAKQGKDEADADEANQIAWAGIQVIPPIVRDGLPGMADPYDIVPGGDDEYTEPPILY
ncbi:MAG: hypothetical protein JNJ61_10785 [Anaerolineae bacterium]|nr:hypothetical protein [Anaerolineae bacterium]